MFYLLVFLALLSPQPQRSPRGRQPEITVPQGWTAEFAGYDILTVKHSSGASLRLVRNRRTQDLQNFAEHAAEGVAAPLGFAHVGQPRHFRDSSQEWFEYEIRGNRLAEHRRILYRAIRNSAGLVEITYENSEDRFDVLLSEAQAITTQFLSK